MLEVIVSYGYQVVGNKFEGEWETSHHSDKKFVIIGDMEDTKELSGKGKLILTGVAKGEITPSEASSLMGAISSQARIIEVDELERRVSELENGNASS